MLCYSQELSKDPNLYTRLVASLAPNIWEMDDVKKGVLCQLFGGVTKVRFQSWARQCQVCYLFQKLADRM